MATQKTRLGISLFPQQKDFVAFEGKKIGEEGQVPSENLWYKLRQRRRKGGG